jgi:predicted permease
MVVEIDLMVLAATIFTGVLAGLAAGAGPAVRLTRPDLALLIRRRDGRSAGIGLASRILVSAQVALAFVLLSATLLLTLGVSQLSARDPGFRRGQALTFQIDPPWTKYDRISNTTPFYDQLLREISEVPGVRGVAANDLLPLASSVSDIAVERNIPIVEGHTAAQAERTPFVVLQLVNPGYHETMGIPLLRGRGFRFQDDSASPPVAVVSQSLASALWPGEHAIGKRLKPGALGGNYNPAAGLIASSDPWYEVVGVVADVKRSRLDEDASFDLYLSHRQRFAPETFVVVQAMGDPRQLLAPVERVLHRLDAEMATYDIATMDQRIAATLWRERLAVWLFQAFGGIATLLALLGIYGLFAQHVVRQRRQIGVRLALGASPGRVGAHVFADVARLLAFGLGSGTLIHIAAAPLGRWLLPGLDWGGVLLPACAALTLSLVALVGALLPAWRAARIDPLTAFREA